MALCLAGAAGARRPPAGLLRPRGMGTRGEWRRRAQAMLLHFLALVAAAVAAVAIFVAAAEGVTSFLAFISCHETECGSAWPEKSPGCERLVTRPPLRRLAPLARLKAGPHSAPVPTRSPFTRRNKLSERRDTKKNNNQENERMLKTNERGERKYADGRGRKRNREQLKVLRNVKIFSRYRHCCCAESAFFLFLFHCIFAISWSSIIHSSSVPRIC